MCFEPLLFFLINSVSCCLYSTLLCNSSSLSIYPYPAGGSKAQTSNEDCGADVTDARGRNFGKIPCCCDEGPDGFQQRNFLGSRKFILDFSHVFLMFWWSSIQSGHPNSCKRPGRFIWPLPNKKTYECESSHKQEAVMRS